MPPRLPQLKFQAVADSLVGREEHTEALTDALHRILDVEGSSSSSSSSSQEEKGPQVVVLQGVSGSGKTHLLKQWYASQQQQQQQHNHSRIRKRQWLCLGQGKYDQQSTMSYGALVEAVTDLLSQVSDRDWSRLGSDLCEWLDDSELQLLEDFIPQVKILLKRFTTENSMAHQDAMFFSLLPSPPTTATGGSTDDKHKDDDSTGSSSRYSMTAFKNPTERFAYIFGCFLGMLSNVLPPTIVLFLDDLQWADENSFLLLKSLCSNRRLSKLLLVLANRPDEFLETHYFPALESILQSTGRIWTPLTVLDLDVHSCNRLVAKVTELREDVTLELTQVCHNKTKGNPYFLLKFLESLQRRELLVYSMQKFQFDWDIPTIECQTDLADNVAAIVLEGIRALEKDTQYCLRFASRLGFSFGEEDLAFLVTGMEATSICSYSNKSITDELTFEVSQECRAKIKNHLEIAVGVGLLDSLGNGNYKFSHDQVLQSFLEMKSSERCAENEGIVLGYILNALFRLHPNSKAWALFGALQALEDYYPNLSPENQMSLVKMNLLAAKKAAKKSAFHDAATYATSALDLLRLASPANPWKTEPALCKTVHVTVANYCLASGKHDQCKSMVEALLEHTTDIQEKANFAYILACSLRNQAKIPQSIIVLQDILDQMGEKMKTGVVARVSTRKETKKEFGKLADEEILNLPVITDSFSSTKMKLLSTLFLNRYVIYEKEKLWLTLKRLLVLTGRLGLCQYSPLIMAAHAYNLANKGDFVEGKRYGDIATKLVDQLNAKVNLPIVTFFLVVFVNHLREPMFKSIPNLKRGFQVGMEHGDSQAAFLCATTEVCYQFMVGNPIQENAKSCQEYFRIAQEYGQDQLKKEILLMWQLTTNLMGGLPNTDPTKFDGVNVGEVDLMKEIMSPDDKVQLKYYSQYVMALGDVYLGRWHEASEYFGVVLTYDEKNQLVTSHYSTFFSTIYGAVTWFKVLTKKKDKKLLAKANKALGALVGWVSKGAINIAAGLDFAQAQKAAIDQSFETVKQMFDKAIVGLHRSGVRNLEGLACQCFAEYAIEKEDLDEASHYLKRARESYELWGAMAAVKFLDEKHGESMSISFGP